MNGIELLCNIEETVYTYTPPPPGLGLGYDNNNFQKRSGTCFNASMVVFASDSHVQMVKTIVQSTRSNLDLPTFLELFHQSFGENTFSKNVSQNKKTIQILYGDTIYTTTGFGLRKIRKCQVYTISWCICKILKYVAKRARSAPVVVWVVAYLNSLRIHQDVVYISHLLIFSRPKAGSVVCIIGVPKY